MAGKRVISRKMTRLIARALSNVRYRYSLFSMAKVISLHGDNFASEITGLFSFFFCEYIIIA